MAGHSDYLAFTPPIDQARWMRSGRKISAAFFLGALLPAICGASPAASERQKIDSIVPLTGGRRIAVTCSGAGKFTVLLETGDGGHRAHMAKLFDALSQRYRVCDYDRRNVGHSSAAPVPRKAAEFAADAFDALAAVGVKGPYILFGTSMGGLLVRYYAATRPVAGFVTSNQPATTGEIKKYVYPVMTPADQAADAAYAAGKNNEHFDLNDLSRVVDSRPPPTVPYIIMISSQRFQCSAAGVCGPAYQAFVDASRAAAQAGARGRLRKLDGDHDLYVTHLDEVVAAIDEVASGVAPHR